MNVIYQIFLALLFFIISFLCFTLPGLYFLKKYKADLNDWVEKYVVSTTLGIVLFTLSAYVLAFLHLRFLMYLFPIFGILSFINIRRNLLNFSLNISRKKLFFTVLTLGIIGQVAVNAFSGWQYKEGIYFWSSHGHDGVWHLSLMQELHKNVFPFQNPEYAGHRLQNYHFFVDLLMSEITRIFHFSNLDIYFRFMPLLFSLLLGLGGFIFVRLWAKKELAGIWSMIFIYFCGSFGYLLTIPKSHNLSGESIFWVSQTQSVLGNPPHAAAFIILTVFLFSLLKFFRTKQISYIVISIILVSSTIEFKVYAGVLILGGLLVISIFESIKRRWTIPILFIATLILSLAIYLPNSVNSQDFLIWQPWWYIRTMVVVPDRLDWLDLELRRQTYLSEHNYKRVLQLEVTAFSIFLFGNLGMRFIGFLSIWKKLRENIFKDTFNLFFLTITLASFIIPVLFLQKGVAWNSIQFNQYFLLLFGFLAAISVSDLLDKFKKNYIKLIFAILIIIFAVPTQIGLLWQFYSNKPLSKIRNEELVALNFLKNENKSDGTVLTAPFSRFSSSEDNPPVPINIWYDTGYISAISGSRTLISDQEQLTIMGYDIKKLFEERQVIFNSLDSKLVKQFLDKYNVSYVYLVDNQDFKIPYNQLGLELIYKNQNAHIYRISR